MKIRFKIAFWYACVTAVLTFLFGLFVYLVSAHDRESIFFDNLIKEGQSKCNIFFQSKASPEVMQSIYKNNIKYIDEVEMAIYDTQNNLVYHDASDIDIVKETPELLAEIMSNKDPLLFYVDKYQAVGLVFLYQGKGYIITATAYDGNGYTKLNMLLFCLISFCVASIFVSFIIGYIFAKSSLKPVSDISKQLRDITAKNLSLRISSYNENDEFGELSASLNDTLDIIEKSFDSQKMFVSNVSHELRTPLAALVGEIDIALLKERSGEEYRSVLTNMHHDVTRLIELVNDLLNLAKASYDESKIAMTRVRLDEILLDAREIVLKDNRDYNIDLQFSQEIEDDSDITIIGNEYLLNLAFSNLMENNCKFSHNKKSLIKIAFLDDNIEISFSDRGIGIPKDDLEKIFEPFFRGQNKEFTRGNGIGLALVSKVINLHKGTIKVESILGEKTTFIINFKTEDN